MKTIALLAVLALVLAPTTASAECAWVLWMQYERINLTPGKAFDTDGWVIVSAVPTYLVCNEAAKQRAERAADQKAGGNLASIELSSLIGGGYGVSTKFNTPRGASILTFRCFPDTVDPRAQAGGQR